MFAVGWLIVWALVVILILLACEYIVGKAGIAVPDNIRKVIIAIVALVFLIYLLQIVLGGAPYFPRLT